MDRVIQALRAYDQQIWQEFHQLKQPPEEKKEERPPAGLPSKQMYLRDPGHEQWKQSLCHSKYPSKVL